MDGETVRRALEDVFAEHQQLRGYVLDEQDGLRTHLVIFVDGQPIRDRQELSDRVDRESEIYVMHEQKRGGRACWRFP